MADSIFYCIQFTFFYFLYLIFIPAKVLKMKLYGKEAFENIIKVLVISHTVIISCVYVLALLHIYNTITLAAVLLLIIIIYYKRQGISYKQKFFGFCEWVVLVGGGQYKLQVYIKKFIRKIIVDVYVACRYYVKRFFSKNIIIHIIFIASIIIVGIRKWGVIFNNYAYLTSDMYVHHEWINFMEAGDIFYDGVYPFAMHNMISAFHKLSGLNLNIVIRYWGCFNCILMIFMLYFFARRLFSSKLAAVLVLVIYCVTDYASLSYGFRTIYTLPQEIGMLFFLPAVYYLVRFLEEEKKEDFIFFVLCASHILSSHFFTVIFAVLLCASICLVYIRRLINWKLLRKLMAGVGLIAVISITPFIIALISGKHWQGSMTWALNVMGNSTQTNEKDMDDTDDTEDAGELVNVKSVSENKKSGNAKEKKAPLTERVKEGIKTIIIHQVEDMNSYWGYVFWVCMALFIFYIGILRFQKNITWKDKMYAGVWIFLALQIVMYRYYIIGIPEIMKKDRIDMFMGYVGPLMLVLPIEMLHRFLPENKKRMAEWFGFVVVGALFFITYTTDLKPRQSYFYLQHSAAAKACVEIDKEFPKGTWTVVSPVEELPLIRNRGYHYELWEFITNMEKFQEDMYLEIPTKYVFFILEKRPLYYNEVRYSHLEYESKDIDMETADRVMTTELMDIFADDSMKYYNVFENRMSLEAKLKAWLEEYIHAFPDQAKVYMEDDECIVYQFEQNIFMFNNFAVDYKYNEISDDEYEALMKQKEERISDEGN